MVLLIILFNLSAILTSLSHAQYENAEKVCPGLKRKFMTQRGKEILFQRFPNLTWFCIQVNQQSQYNLYPVYDCIW